MKKFVILLFLLILFTGCSSKEVLYNGDSLDIISQHDGYVIAVDQKYSEANTYAMYKNVSYNDYEIVWTFDIANNVDIENHNIIWNDNAIYLLGYDCVAYDIDSGKEISVCSDTLMPLSDDDSGNGKMDSILGISNSYIYYRYSSNLNHYVARVSLDLKNVEVINDTDIPGDIKK